MSLDIVSVVVHYSLYYQVIWGPLKTKFISESVDRHRHTFIGRALATTTGIKGERVFFTYIVNINEHD